jgi:hypothetical protein
MPEPASNPENRLTLLLCLVISLLLHVAVLAAWGALGDASQTPAAKKDAAEPFEHAALETLTPGIDAETPARLTWVGYDESLAHFVNPAEVTQAAMERGGETRAAIGAGGVAAASPQPHDLAEAAQRTAALARAVEQAVQQARAQRQRVDQLLREATDALLAQAAEAAAAREAALAALAAAKALQAEQARMDESENEAEATDATATADAATGSADGPGDPSDRAADPSTAEPTIVEVRPGKPIARQGVDVRTTKPQISVITWSTARARPPLMRLDFRADGTVDQVTIIETSGDSAIDQALVDSLYEWTASGADIDALGAREKLPFIVRLLPF